MKNTTKLIVALAISAASLQASVLTGLTGTTTDGIGYTISGNPTFLANGGIEAETNGGGTVVFTFDSLVNLTISPNSDNPSGRTNFDGSNTNNTFAADAGAWTYTPGATITLPVTIAGSTLTTQDATGSGGTIIGSGGNSVGNVAYDDAWGSFTLTGANELTWSYTNGTNFESFTFDAVAAPEPSSTALLGLGGLALLARRRR